ncbi:LysM peptidoglycan-binding domain-containing protein [Rufibacter sp. LB8]|uniref:LysM peptidoglycan-binding domain-containing protein n=1 Tax=Rufibacter sp. LB8 TaxID=2777781 RepID=UPI00178C72D1|nr:LysM peptidoglycan-binding domain-containing protein [Rufibacter sp. LB8]
MKRTVSLLLLSLLCWVARAQSPVVPYNISFADMQLEIKEDARADIQKIVNALTKHPAYFQKKVDLADAYFPFIEQAFQQEGVPTDFKYLVLQESGLVSDAVSTSNAVGFWQFKEASATELGIKVNSQVDERKHIIASSRGAAKYLLRSNVYYQNWFNSLLSYYQGLTGTKALTKTSDIGMKKMAVTSQTNKYLLTFLAHKVAYENAIGKNPKPTLTLQPVKASPGQTLMEIALQAQADATEVERYNKWLLASNIPADKEYTVMIPMAGSAARPVLAQAPVSAPAAEKSAPAAVKDTPPVGEKLKSLTARIKNLFTTSNNISSIVAQPGDTKDMLAMQAGISTRKFLRVNDMRSFDQIEAGKTYYLKAKASKSETDYHVARAGETMHSISQKYGVKLKKLLSKNRMKKTEAVVPGRVIWLKDTRPASIPVEIRYPNDEPTIIAQKPASAAPAQVAAPVTPAPAKPVKPKEGSISVEVEDANTPYVPNVKKTEGEDSVAAKALYPGKSAEVANKPAPPIERKAPEEPISVVVEPTPATAKPISVEVATSHKVEKGETLYAISKLHNVSMEDLLAWNNLDGSKPLALGQELSLTGPAADAQPSAAPATPAKTSATTAPAKTAAPASSTSAATEHTVVAGETLYAISKKYNVTLQNLQTWNNLGTNGSISLGQKLVVAAPAEATPVKENTVAPTAAPQKSAAGTVTHKVTTGESMYQISRKYGVTIKEIMEWNGKPDFNVTVGESLLIKPKN